MVEEMRLKRQKLEDKFYQTLTSQFTNEQSSSRSPLRTGSFQVQTNNLANYQQEQPVQQAYDSQAYYSAPLTASNKVEQNQDFVKYKINFQALN